MLIRGLNSGSLAHVKGCYRISDPAKMKPKIEKEKPPKKMKKVVKKNGEKVKKKKSGQK